MEVGLVRYIGEHILTESAASENGKLIATVFPRFRMVVSVPGIHATQHMTAIDTINQDRQLASQPPLTEAEEDDVLSNAVDLIVDHGVVLIRPDPDRMDLAFSADAILQEDISKRNIRFLYVSNPKVRQAMNQRGEAWRIHPLPRSVEQICKHIQQSRVAINGLPIYYYNAVRGTRLLTMQEFHQLDQLPDDRLRLHMIEIARHSNCFNAIGASELDFFMADESACAAELKELDLANMPAAELRQLHAHLVDELRHIVPVDLQVDNPHNNIWRQHMYGALLGQRGDELTESDLLGLGSEFFMQVEWLPGARLENGELIFDSVFDQALDCEDKKVGESEYIARSLICNIMQDQGDIEFINIGQILKSMSPKSSDRGRREVFLAHFRKLGMTTDTLQIIRLQKWDVRERLDNGDSLLEAIYRSNEYTDYILDRRLGCKQLGMKLPPTITVRRLAEHYIGRRAELCGTPIWTTYFQRPYVPGIASDKIPASRLNEPGYAMALATLLGESAAPNIIVGRKQPDGQVIFDDGDEMIIEGIDGLPSHVVVSDHTGTFTDFAGSIEDMAVSYAKPVLQREGILLHKQAFIDQYLKSFEDRFVEIQTEYRNRRRAFDTLFKHREIDPAGNFAYRWASVLKRLDQTDVKKIIGLIRDTLPIK